MRQTTGGDRGGRPASRGVRRWSVVAAGALLALTACDPTPTYVGTGPKLAAIGDSITWASTGALKAQLGAYSHWVWGTSGIDLVKGRTSLVDPAVATTPQVMVIELGINSVVSGWTAAASSALSGIIYDVAAVPCVVWVTPDALSASNFDSWGPGTLHQRIAAWRALLAQRLVGHANVHQADWGPIETTHPEWYQSDGLHPSPAGQQAFASYVVQQATTWCHPH